MNTEPKNLDVLQNLETAVVNEWQKHREMTDHVVARAYEAAFEHYRAEVRGHTPKTRTLSGLDGEVFGAVMQMCQFRLGRPEAADGNPPPIPVSDLVDCLRQLRKSVHLHTNNGGRQGYLTFVSKYLG